MSLFLLISRESNTTEENRTERCTDTCGHACECFRSGGRGTVPVLMGLAAPARVFLRKTACFTASVIDRNWT